MAHDRSLRLAAPAKLNLFLHIEGRRADGLHLVDSLIAFAEIGDALAITPADTRLSLAIDGPFAAALPLTDDNLVLRAAGRLREQARIADGAAIRLTKALPVASGIGGGSADAAAALHALARLWRVDPVTCDLAAIAAMLGADVPVCLAGRTSRVGGIGTDIADGPPLPAAALVLANPGIAVPTADVFRAYAASARPVQRQVDSPGVWDGIADAQALAARLRPLENDLEAPAIALAPAIAETLAALRALPDCLLARMSGSGATCFALFGDDNAAQDAARSLQAAFPYWWVAPTRLRTRPPQIEAG